MDALGIGLGTSLMQMVKDINFRYEEVPDNAVLCPIALPKKVFPVYNILRFT